jgi:5-methylcytosine-specific restriction enzyme subunit McrC
VTEMLRTVTGRDLSPFLGLQAADEQWLRHLVRNADLNSLTLRLSRSSRNEPEPVARFDERTGTWWAGRYVGELRYLDRTLVITPRFGEPTLRRWLARIWGIQLLSSRGRYETARIWLWEVIAHLWTSRLLTAAKHGLPSVRVTETHVGAAARGRLLVPATACELGRGRENLVTDHRARRVDGRIGGIVLAAYHRLRAELRGAAGDRAWLTDRGLGLVEQLRAHVGSRDLQAALASGPVRYTPITESYRPLVQLSQAILQQRPFSSTATGDSQVLGILLDMAEIWELYVYHLLRAALPGIQVTHAGREDGGQGHLLWNAASRRGLGALKPDVLLTNATTGQLLGVLDAKYKTTQPSPDRPHGILREDLYQMAAYLAGLGTESALLSGALVYPVGANPGEILALEASSPWVLTGTRSRAVSFLALLVDEDTTVPAAWSPGEERFLTAVRHMLIQPSLLK